MKDLLSILQNPSKDYRPAPFWSWNDSLEPEFLKWQIGEMKKTGHGGYFMHARGGLKTDYLSDEWMECIKTGIDGSKNEDMNAWAYDECGWPSGFAGGIVTALGEYYHMRWMEIEEIEAGSLDEEDESILGLYLHQGQCNKLTSIDQSEVSKKLDNHSRILAIRQKRNQYYIDILNKEVVKAFIDSTYEKYYDAFKEEFGTGLKGFFTDEPQYSRGKIPWSNTLPEQFRTRYGYELIEVLPKLFLEVEGYEQARYDYWNMISDLYVKSFGKQIYDWCEAHNCQLTGHSIQEGTMYNQMGFSAGVMPFYEYMQIPGMDWLGRAIDSPVIPKSVESVASQLGKKFVLSETFALCGWDVSFEELKWIAEWQYVNGVNFLCQHLESYTLKGLRKRDYPASLFYHQSWWEEYRVFNDYFARLGRLLAEGEDAVKVLLLHPMKSGWIAYNWQNNDKLQQLDKDFDDSSSFLSNHQIEHHYGDETIIAKHGKVEEGRFVVGNCKYDIVMLPSMTTIDQSTLELLDSFMSAGGTVIAMGDLPSMCNGHKCKDLDKGLGRVIKAEDWNLVLAMLEAKEIRRVRVTDEGEDIPCIHIKTKDLGDKQVIYMVNHSQSACYYTEVKVIGNGNLSRLNLEKNIIEDLKVIQKQGSLVAGLTFEPMQSHVLIHEKEAVTPVGMDEVLEEVQLKDTWSIEGMGMNALTLDYCRYSIDGGEYEKEIPVIKLMEILLNLRKPCHIDLKFNFQVDMNLEENKTLYLAIETADEFDILVNGTKVVYDGKSWWKDSAFQQIDIKQYVHSGNNEIQVSRDFYQDQKVYDVLFGDEVLETEVNKLTYNTELESLYIIGDFGVISQSNYTYGERKAIFTDGPFVIVDAPKEVISGDLTEQGFCFLAEPITLTQEVELASINGTRLILKLNKPNAVITKVFVNDKTVKSLPWAPYSVDISDYVQVGTNKISIKLYPGNRNLLGPHHHVNGELYFVGPSSFTDQPGWADGEAKDIWREGYCFVEFGL